MSMPPVATPEPGGRLLLRHWSPGDEWSDLAWARLFPSSAEIGLFAV